LHFFVSIVNVYNNYYICIHNRYNLYAKLCNLISGIEMSNIKTIVIDDDPTGCQTVHGVNVLLSWTSETLSLALSEYDVVFLITNSRSFREGEAIRINKEIIGLLKPLSNEFDFRIISRGDSTLRGHFYAETKAILSEWGNFDGVIFCPFFEEGGRITINNTH
jgi:uncharacterized protein YgbK (DUF1537 family)